MKQFAIKRIIFKFIIDTTVIEVIWRGINSRFLEVDFSRKHFNRNVPEIDRSIL